TYLQANRAFDFEEMEPVRVKGKSEALRVYRLAAPKRRDDPACFGLNADLVGRGEELSLLGDRLEQLVRGGRGGILWVTGEAGIGKSRLLAEARKRFGGDALLWLEGRALSYGQTISYWPFLEIFKAFAGITEEDDEIQGWRKLQARINRLFPDEVADTLPYLATLLAMEVKGNLTSRVQFLDGDSMRRQIFRTSRHFFSRLSREQPLVLAFEDFHWADRSSVELVKHLLPLAEREPVLFCFASRSEEPASDAGLGEKIAREYGDFTTRIHLQPLESAQSERMVCSLLGIDELSPQMKDIVQIKSQGNPLFLEELIRTLVDAGIACRDKAGGRWRLKPIRGKVPVPGSLRTLIAAGIDRLDEDIKEVLRVASVIGRSFLYRLLREIIASREVLDQDLNTLEEKDLIREKCRVPELEYVFKHDLIKESIYESILLEQRKGLHRKVGEAIERIFPHNLERFYGLLAYHYAQAADWGKAHEYLLKTGDQAGRMAADTEALAHYRKAVAAYDRMFGRQWDSLQRAVLERKIGEALFRKGAYRQASDSIRRALELLGDPLPETARDLRLGIARQAAVQALHRTLPTLFCRGGPIDDPAFEEWMILRKHLAWIDYCNNNERLLFNLLSSLNRVEKRGYPEGMTLCYSGLGMTMDALGRGRIARRYHNHALRLAERADNPFSESQAYYGYGMHLHFSGRRQEAVEMYDRSAAIGRELGDVKQWAGAVMLKAILHHQVGAFHESLDLCRQVTEAGREVSDGQIIGWGLAGQGKNLMFLSEIDQAEARISEAVPILRRVPDLFVLVSTMNDQAVARMLQGDDQQALEILTRARRLIHKQSLVGHCVWDVHYTWAELCLRLKGRKDRNAQGPSDPLNAAMDKIRKIAGKQRMFRPRYLRLAGRHARITRGDKQALARWNAALREAKDLENRLEEGLTYLEMGQGLQEPLCFERCRAVFQELDARTYLEQTDQCLAARTP
ncbi:MAG: AAA family ATPase, partial [Deltaproteobacteria bacterium]|nr:AAA family ATPase [Deltaproteobacteria bacterium]